MSQARIAKPIRKVPPAIRHRPELWLFRYTEQGTHQQCNFAERCLATCGDFKYFSSARPARGERGAPKSPGEIINIKKIARDMRINAWGVAPFQSPADRAWDETITFLP